MTLVYPLLVVLLAVFAIAPLEYPGAFQSHTGMLAVYNLIQYDLQPMRFLNWIPALGRTEDLLRADAYIPYLSAELFHLIGLNYLDSIKLVYAASWVGSGLSMYAFARRRLSEPAALLAAVVYIYLPFHIATVYIRGAFGESFAWAIFPLAMSTVLFQDQARSIRLSWKGITLFLILFLCQPGMAILFGILVLALAIAENRYSRDMLISSLATVAIGLALGFLFILPAIFSTPVAFGLSGFQPHFVLPFQLFSSAWGFGMSQEYYTPTLISNQAPPSDPFPYQIGIAPIALSILAIAVVLGHKEIEKSDPAAKRIATMFTFAALILLLCVFDISRPIWRVFGYFATFPYQLLAFIGLSLALVSGSIIDLGGRFKQPAMVAFLVALPVLASYGYLSPRYIDFSPTRPIIATFENNEIALLDYRIVGPLRHGATIRLQLQWQALRQVNRDYTVFVHAVQSDGQKYGSEDSKPVEGALPTLKWAVGQVIYDTHTIQIDVEGPREDYHLEIGLYQAANGRRALIDGGGEYLVLPRPGDPEPTISDQLTITSAH